MRLASLILLFLSGYAMAQSGVKQSPYASKNQNGPLNAIKMRLGLPVLTHGPGYDFGDVPQSFVNTGSAIYSYNANQCGWGFTVTSLTQNTGVAGSTGANTCTSPGTGDTIQSNGILSFTPNTIAAIPPAQNTNICGSWPEASYKVGVTWFMLVHDEGPCNYAVFGQTNESMSMWTSSTGAPGSWSPMVVGGVSNGTIISSTEAPTSGPLALTGFGNGSMIPDENGQWMYAYVSFFSASNLSDYHNAVARAPMTALGPGNWMMEYQGCFCIPALNNTFNTVSQLPNADLFPLWINSAVATMPGSAYKVIVVDGFDHAFNIPTQETYNGIALSIALSYTGPFTTLHSPILNYDTQTFGGRPLPSDSYVYAIIKNNSDGSSVLSKNSAALWTMWMPPNNSLNSRYVVEYPITISSLSKTDQNFRVPQIAISLETYQNTSSGNPYSGSARSTTVNPAAGISSDGAIETGWAAQSFLGYILTSCPGSATINACDANGAQIANRIEECWSGATLDDYQLQIDTNGTAGSCPSGWTHVRTAGWLYKHAQAFGTTAIYACSRTATGTHFSSISSTCNGQTFIALLGYAASN